MDLRVVFEKKGGGGEKLIQVFETLKVMTSLVTP